MSFVIAQPDFVAAAATDLANMGSAIGEAHATALAPTTEMLAAGADEISAAVAALFGSHAQSYPGPQRRGGGISSAVCAGQLA